jgi:alpha-tubulin suppressor-like RCC1 family protein
MNFMNIRRNLIQICLLGAVLLQALTSGAQPVTQVAAGTFHSLFLKGDGSLWAMGENNAGQLGDGTFSNTNRPEIIVASNVTAIAAGNDVSLFLKSDGSLWGMGNATLNNTNQPEMIVASNVTAIATGGIFILFLKSDGSLWAMGNNQFGQLGDGTFNNTNQPEMIVASNVTAIAAGGDHSLFLKNDGSLWAMGYNFNGQLGDGTFDRTAPFGTNLPEQIVSNDVTAVAAGGYHTLFIKSDGSLWAMGGDVTGQLGDGAFDDTNLPEMIVASNVTAIAAGGYYSLFLKQNGSLWAMGADGSGELGDGTYNNLNVNRPEQIESSSVTAIAAASHANFWLGGPVYDEHSLFAKNDGSLWAMGYNRYGELGDGTYSDQGTNLPEQIVAGPPGYNQISVQLLSGGNVSLSYVGIAGTNYLLDQSFSLSLGNWIPQLTNSAGVGGVLVFTNTPDPTTNNFWRIRSVP